MAVKIQTNKKNNFNQTVQFIEGIKVKFNDEGIASIIDKATAKKLVENSDFLFYEGMIPEKKKDVIVIPVIDSKKDDLIKDFQFKLHVANQRVDSLKADKGLLEASLKDWKAEVEKLTADNESLRKIVGPDKKEEEVKVETKKEEPKKEDEKKDEKDIPLEDKLKAMKVPDLKDMCKKLELDPGEWETLKKEDLIKYLIEKSEDKKE